MKAINTFSTRVILSHTFLITKARRVNKRIFIVLLMASALLVMFSKIPSVQSETLPSTFDDGKALLIAQKKVKGERTWQPVGWGSGEYITTLPVIRAGVVLNFESGEVIWSMKLKEKIAPASLSKLATVATALDLADL